MKNSILLFLPLLTLIACSPKSKPAAQLHDSIVANASSTSEGDWHSSEKNPEKIFTAWNSDLIEKKITTADVCAGLNELNDQDLSFFEEELRSPQNAALISDCSREVDARLKTYWKQQKKTLSVTVDNLSIGGSSFQFKDDVQYRDTSSGYMAVSGDVAPKEIVLTFDDGPSDQYTPMILQTLKSVNAKAIFFEMGANVKRFPQVSKMVAAGGHSLGGHSITHRCLANKTICLHNNGYLLTYQQAITEIAGSLRYIYDAVGWVDPFFRFPYGESSPDLKRYLQDNGIGEFYWSIDSEDWKSKTPQMVIDDTMRQIRQRGRGIVLFHDIHHRTAEALPQFLTILHSEGYQPVLLKPMPHQGNAGSIAELPAQ